jgi:hypothetical protein
MTMQLMPPADGNHGSIRVNGRDYSCALGSTITVPDADGFVMIANGWLAASVGGSGATAQRPSNPLKGQEFHDTTLGFVIRYDGKAWRNPNSGAAA